MSRHNMSTADMRPFPLQQTNTFPVGHTRLFLEASQMLRAASMCALGITNGATDKIHLPLMRSTLAWMRTQATLLFGHCRSMRLLFPRWSRGRARRLAPLLSLRLFHPGISIWWLPRHGMARGRGDTVRDTAPQGFPPERAQQIQCYQLRADTSRQSAE